jgi:hypothetical protein
MSDKLPFEPEHLPVVVGAYTPVAQPNLLARIKGLFATRQRLVIAAVILGLILVMIVGIFLLLANHSSPKSASETAQTSGSPGGTANTDSKSGASTTTPGAPNGKDPKKDAAKKPDPKAVTTPGGQSSSGGGTAPGGSTSGNGNAGGTTPSYAYTARWSVGAPGVAHYNQTQATLPVPAGYTEVSGNGTAGEWDIYDCSTPQVYDHYYFHAFIYIGTGCSGSVTIKNSIIAPPAGTNQRSILNNSNGGVDLVIQDTTIRPEPVPLGGTNDALTDHVVNNCGSTCHITLTRLDVSNSGGLCLCGENTLVQNSWLHDSYIAHLSDPSVAHTGGVFPYGGSGPVEVSHNRLEPGYNVGTGTEVTNYWKAITAVLFTQSSGGTQLHNYNVHDNFISLGAFDMDLEDGIGIIVKNNVFGPSHWGATSTCSSGCTVTYSDWSGNVLGDIDGAPSTTVVNHP